MALKEWTGATDGQWIVAANWGGAIPVDGDDILFDGDVKVNPCTSGPAVVVGINSITTQDAYDAACCFDNVVVNTVTMNDNSFILGGVIALAILDGTTSACCINSVTAVVAVANLTGTDVRIYRGMVGVANLTGPGSYAHSDAAGNAVITTAYISGGLGAVYYARLARCQVGTVYLQGDSTRLQNTTEGIGAAKITAYISGNNCKISATQIAAEEFEAIYIMAHDIVLKDDDTGKVMADTTTADQTGPGEW